MLHGKTLFFNYQTSSFSRSNILIFQMREHFSYWPFSSLLPWHPPPSIRSSRHTLSMGSQSAGPWTRSHNNEFLWLLKKQHSESDVHIIVLFIRLVHIVLGLLNCISWSDVAVVCASRLTAERCWAGWVVLADDGEDDGEVDQAVKQPEQHRQWEHLIDKRWLYFRCKVFFYAPSFLKLSSRKNSQKTGRRTKQSVDHLYLGGKTEGRSRIESNLFSLLNAKMPLKYIYM